MRIIDDQIINITTLANTTSEIIDISHLWMYSIQFTTTGTPTGTTSVECSNDGVNWKTVTDSSESLSGTPGAFMFNTAGNVGYKYVRAKYAHTSGAGTLKAHFFGKGV